VLRYNQSGGALVGFSTRHRPDGFEILGRIPMAQQHDIEANKDLVRRFIQAIVQHDYATMDKLLHPDFVWNTAVVADNAPNELRKMQSKTMQGKNLHHAKPRLNRAESMAVFKQLFSGNYGGSMSGHDGKETTVAVHDDKYRLHLDILGMTAEEDRVAMEGESNILNPTNGRTYNNFYHYLFRVKDGQLILYKEYQDTLHLFDYQAE
jgi:ketosteroid isomerase-like protein